MGYRVFISHASDDVSLARAVARSIKDAFPEQVEPCVFADQVTVGKLWKEELKRTLEECEALVSIITPASIHRPWLYIEWSHFWLDDKKIYVLVSDDVDTAALVAPMNDTQVVRIQDESSVRNFFRALRDDARVTPEHPLPPDHVPVFLEQVSAAFDMDLAASIDRYAKPSAELPDDDREKRKILEYFYNKGEIDTFRMIFRKVRHDAFQADVAIWVLKKNDLETTQVLCEEIKSAEHLYRVAWEMVEAGHTDSSKLRHLLGVIRSKNEAELRKFAIQLFDRDQDDSDLFQYILGIMTNMAEMRKIPIHFIGNGLFEKQVFDEIVDKVGDSNRAELRKVALEFVSQELQRSRQFDKVMGILIAKGPKQAILVFEELEKRDPEMLQILYDRYQPMVDADNSAIKWLRKKLGLEDAG